MTPEFQLIAAVLLATLAIAWVVHRAFARLTTRRADAATPEEEKTRRALFRSARGPVLGLVAFYGAWLATFAAASAGVLPAEWDWLETVLARGAFLGAALALFWFAYRASRALDAGLQRLAARTDRRLDDFLYPLIGSALRLAVPILAVILLLRLLPLSAALQAVAAKALTIVLILALTWLARRAILLVDAAVLRSQTPASADERALFTRVRVLRKIALAFLTVFAISAVLMTFEEVRDIGRSLLASAGIAGIVIGFAAQRSLGNLFAGLQIALTQPIRLGDLVLVEGDVGNVEEITLTYVVVRVWDARRIVLPISYFIERPFQNWTRGPTNMLSPMTMRFDFLLPVDELRAHLKTEIERSRFWDRKVFAVHVTNADQNGIEVRVLGSAADPGASFELQAELREKAVTWVRQHHPECLPKQRREQKQLQHWRPWIADGNGHGHAPAAPADAPPARG
jgi:small-conductance mechanosensitive channel